MPTFNTPEPITATIEIIAGDVRVTASDCGDTVVDVRPSDSSDELDVWAAEQTRVEHSPGRLLVKMPKQRGFGLFGRTGSIDLTVELPAGSHLEAEAGLATVRCEGRLGDCHVKTGAGDIHVAAAGNLDLSTGAGSIEVARVAGDADVSTSLGKVRLGEIDGGAVVKSSNGDIRIGEIGGVLRANTANGDISVDRAGADVTASTAKGDLRIGQATCGAVSLKTGFGQIEIGVRSGTAARLDVQTGFGRVRNQMDVANGPGPSEETVDVHARTGYGDIAIHRS